MKCENFIKMIKKYFFINLFVVMSLLTVNGCSHYFWQDDVPPCLTVEVITDETINPNIDNESTPITVQVLQLNDNEMFAKNRFIDIYNDPDKVLGKSLVSSKYNSGINPSSSVKIPMDLNKDTKYVAAIAGFSKYDSDNGKIIIPIKNKQKDLTLELKISGTKLMLNTKDD